jgi:hypothetical protein
MNRPDPHPLHPSLIRNADPVYRVDVTEHTQEVLRRRAQQVHPTMRTTRGRPEWRWGRTVDAPRNSGAPVTFSPSELEPGRTAEAPSHPSLTDYVRRLRT